MACTCKCGCVLGRADKYGIAKHEKTYRHIIMLNGGTMEEACLYKYRKQFNREPGIKQIEDKSPMLVATTTEPSETPPMAEEYTDTQLLEPKQRYTCPCGCIVVMDLSNINKHRKTSKHKRLMNNVATGEAPPTSVTATDI